jgi:ABC-type amino acid transport substrate-binding protein
LPFNSGSNYFQQAKNQLSKGAFMTGWIKKGGLFLFALLLMPLSTCAQQLSGDSWATVKQNGGGKIILTYVKTPAFVYEEEGELQGICIDIMDSFVNYIERSEDVDLEVEYVEGDNFSSYYQSVKDAQGGVFGLANTTITEERKQEVQFSPPYITNIAVLTTNSSVPDLSSMDNIAEEFAGMKAFAPTGSIQYDRMKEIKDDYYPGLNIELVPSSGEALERISNGAKAFCYQDIALYWNYKENGMPIKRHPVGDQSSEKFGIIMPANSDWAPMMEKFFAMGSGFKSTSIYRTSLVKHLGTEVLQMLQMTSDN